MQNSDSEKARNVADRDDEEEEEATGNDGAAEEAVGDRDDDEAPSRDDVVETAADRATDGAEGTGVAEPDDEAASSDAEQQAAAGDDRDRKEARKKKGDCVWTMYLPSTSGKEALAVPNNNYGCEHYKRKSKFVVSLGRIFEQLIECLSAKTNDINININSFKNWHLSYDAKHFTSCNFRYT